MSQVKAAARTGGLCRCRDSRQIKSLTGAVLHAGPQHQRNFTAALLQQLQSRLLAYQVCIGPGCDLDQAVCGAKSVPSKL